MHPVIGIPCLAAERAISHRPLYGNNQSYVRAVAQAGGIPLLLPPQFGAAQLAELAERLDGLLLAGGEDVSPALYGEDAIPQCETPSPERDELELELTRWALDHDLPLLAICRGIQLLNVATGGTLYQDLPTQQPGAQRHAWSDHPRTHLAHEMLVAPGSPLAGILGSERLAVNSLHHQAIARLGAGVDVLARAPDGVIEAIAVEGHSFALGVQYHPEELAPTDPPSQRLFAAFVAASAERMATQRSPAPATLAAANHPR